MAGFGSGNPRGNPRFQKGVSGNPGGKRPGQTAIENAMREAAHKYAPDCLQFLMDVVSGKIEESKGDISSRTRAAMYLIDRAVGKPAQAVHVAGADGGAIQVQHSVDAFIDQLKGLRKRIEDTELKQIPHMNGHDAS